MNARQIQVAFGHAYMSVTLGIYGHLFGGADDALGASMEARRAQYRQCGSRNTVVVPIRQEGSR